jgi:septum formation protein
MQLVLASSSPYRRALLGRLNLAFTASSPEVDETALPGEDASTLVLRLALAKARALAPHFPDALIIGSDQVCQLDDRLVGKPHTFERARDQLLACSGRRVDFHTGLVLFDTRSGEWQQAVDLYSVTFRELTMQEIEYYLRTEQPYDCAGSFKVEGLGISLFSALEGPDYHSLIGLPLLQLCAMLRQSGLNPLLADSPVSA